MERLGVRLGEKGESSLRGTAPQTMTYLGFQRAIIKALGVKGEVACPDDGPGSNREYKERVPLGECRGVDVELIHV